ncbi:UNVERIFIED_CONTAM: hypothetical protein GTU68_002893 [Idotea baltica]|nr:hypothetical protein [Idotea baltica]
MVKVGSVNQQLVVIFLLRFVDEVNVYYKLVVIQNMIVRLL